MHSHQTVGLKVLLQGHLTDKSLLCRSIFGRHVLLIVDHNAADELLPWQFVTLLNLLQSVAWQTG